MVLKVVEVSIEVHNGTARFDVAVRAESIRQVLNLVGARYRAEDVRVKFPIEPEGIFVKDSVAREGIDEAEWPERIVA